MFNSTDEMHLKTDRPVLLCLSHLRWEFVFQRPQHLMTGFAASNDVLFWEEPVYEDILEPTLKRYSPAPGVTVVTPALPQELIEANSDPILEKLLLAELQDSRRPLIKWFYTPMALPFTRKLDADCTVYDCMDELANFDLAPASLVTLEKELLKEADLVFTGGHSLYEAKAKLHPRVRAFPSSVDVDHFLKARGPIAEPADQASLPGPRLGYVGVIDERLDLELLGKVAAARPDWTFVMVGPVVKIDPASLPTSANIHYLGSKSYSELPAYLSGWDVALMPFAINAATEFISPTKTPEYLAAGRPVVSTPITDVVRQYGSLEGVSIASTHEDFVLACERMLKLELTPKATWRSEVELALSQMSWSNVVREMSELMHSVLHAKGLSDLYFDYVVVGAGFAGSVMAERLAADLDKKVLVLDRRPHIAGNAYDHLDDAGVMVHKYGPHIFHTNSQDIVDYLSRFTKWRPYEHRVLASVDGKQVPVPINRTTLNALYNVRLETDDEAKAFLQRVAEPVADIRSSEDVVVSQVGRRLYEKLFRGYTRKQWGLDPSQLDKSVTARIPTRTNDDDRYFTDKFQAMPADGYTSMFEKMLSHPNITVALGVDYRIARDFVSFGHLVYTGPIDEFFDHCYGKLPYRSLTFKHETLPAEFVQAVGTINYPDEGTPYTRVTEFKHLTGQDAPSTSIMYEYPSAEGDPFYPIPRVENANLYKRYEALALGAPNVTFVGRLATYRYYNMDQVVGQALATYRRHVAKLSETVPGPLPVPERSSAST